MAVKSVRVQIRRVVTTEFLFVSTAAAAAAAEAADGADAGAASAAASAVCILLCTYTGARSAPL